MERRRLRSNIAYQAVEFYLGRLKQRSTLRAIALADEDGLLLAGIGAPKELELLALWGALDISERGRYAHDIAAICRDGSCVAERFCLDESTKLSVTCVGSTGSEPVSLVAQSALEADLRRILGSQVLSRTGDNQVAHPNGL